MLRLSYLGLPIHAIDALHEMAQRCILHPRMYHFLEATDPIEEIPGARGRRVTIWDAEKTSAIMRIRKAFCRACGKSDALSEFFRTITAETELGCISPEDAAHLIQVGKDSYELPIPGSRDAHDHSKAAEAPMPAPAASQKTHDDLRPPAEASTKQLGDCLSRTYRRSKDTEPSAPKEPVPFAAPSATSSTTVTTTSVSYKLQVTIPDVFFGNFRKLLSTLERSESTKKSAELLAEFERKNRFQTNDAALSELCEFLEKIRNLVKTPPENELVRLIKLAIAEIADELIS